MWYGQWVIGPPGSGKTTYCHGMQQMCSALQRRSIVINLDPANDALPYDCTIDIRMLIDTEEVMEKFSLGPNGALMYSIEYIVSNFDWLQSRLMEYKDYYIIFDCPGQVELYCHHPGMAQILQYLQKLDARLTVCHLVDSTLCTDPYKYISSLLVSLSGQISLELPFVNIFTKIDLLNNYSDNLVFRIDYYSQVQDLEYLLGWMQENNPLNAKFLQFNNLLCEMIEDYNLVSFRLLDIQDKNSVLNILKEIDQANGFSLGSRYSDLGIFNISIAAKDDVDDNFGTIHERYIDLDEEDEIFDEASLESIKGKDIEDINSLKKHIL